ncbi:hypothetical protein NDU88_000527, partial [Pleurodeles waltl]
YNTPQDPFFPNLLSRYTSNGWLQQPLSRGSECDSTQSSRPDGKYPRGTSQHAESGKEEAEPFRSAKHQEDVEGSEDIKQEEKRSERFPEEGEDGEKEWTEDGEKERMGEGDTGEQGEESQEEDVGTENRGDEEQEEDGVTEDPGD